MRCLEEHERARLGGERPQRGRSALARQKPLECEAVGRQTAQHEGREHGARAGERGDGHPGRDRGLDEHEAGVAHGWHARVGEHEHVGLTRELDDLGRLLALVMFVQGHETRAILDAERAHEVHRRTRVFGDDHGHRLERLDEAPARVAEVADGRRGENDHAFILPPRPARPDARPTMIG